VLEFIVCDDEAGEFGKVANRFGNLFDHVETEIQVGKMSEFGYDSREFRKVIGGQVKNAQLHQLSDVGGNGFQPVVCDF